MTEADILAELAAIRAARMAIYQTGTSYSRNGFSLTRANLGDLKNQERSLLVQLQAIRGEKAFVFDHSNGTRDEDFES